MRRLTFAFVAVALAGPVCGATTDPAGNGVPFDNHQPGLVLTQLITTAGVFPGMAGAASRSIGEIRTFAGFYRAFEAPVADGALLSIPANIALFSLYGISYGGNGVSTFALPDLSGRVIVGGESEPGNRVRVGPVTGQATVTLAEAQLPAHAHGLPDGGVTGLTGGGLPFDNRQPGLDLTWMIAADAPLPGAASGAFVGLVAAHGATFAPSGWLPADGRLLSPADYPALFSVIGTRYGGDGVTSFALPDLVGRTPIGAGNGPGGLAIALGEQLGEPLTTLGEGQLPPHSHGLPGGGATDPAGGGLPVSNLMPALGLNFVIATQGVFPTIAGIGNLPADQPFIGEVLAFAGDPALLAPAGFLPLDGRLLSISGNITLFSIIGTAYGGNGVTQFALPDLRGRVIVGPAPGLPAGTAFGTAAVTLSVANLPAHVHSLPDPGPPIPEPATWATLVAGFGLVGARLRRRPAMAAR